MASGWTPMFEQLRLYVTHFAGQVSTLLEAGIDVRVAPAAAIGRVRGALGIDGPGQVVDVRGAKGEVERVDADRLLVRLTGPVPGMLAFAAYVSGEDACRLALTGFLFSADAPAFVQREQPGWQAWLEGLDVDGAAAPSTS
jgi:hypothetical protein